MDRRKYDRKSERLLIILKFKDGIDIPMRNWTDALAGWLQTFGSFRTNQSESSAIKRLRPKFEAQPARAFIQGVIL
jgi:hypothetical protein